MKVLFTLMALLCAYSIQSQEEIIAHFDFESIETSAQFLHFGSNMEGKMTSPVPNPLPTSLNMSQTVLPLVKGSDAEVWGGAFLNPDLEEPLDATYVRQICMKVMFVLPGSLALKLEADPFDDPDNWITVKEVPVGGEWMDVCFDLNQPSIEGNNSYPYGKVYDRLVFYPDFGKAGNGQDGSIYFIDDLSIHYDRSGIRKSVTFGIDMSTYTEPFEAVYVSGSFNGWSGSAFPLEDDGTGYYTGTTTMASGEIEYKYSIDQWADQEQFLKYGECTKTTLMSDGFAYVNRVAMISEEDADLGGMSWGSCYAAGEGVDITWTVNMSEETVSDDGVYLAGGCCFSHGEYRMWDDKDEIYKLTIERQRGFAGHYTFTNGICLPGWSCKEDLQDEYCGDPASYNDRYLEAVEDDVTMEHCFGQCGDDGYCEPAVGPSLVTFMVDMAGEDIHEDGVMLSGTFSDWVDLSLTHVGDEEYAITVELMPGLHQWKYKNGPSVWESLEEGESCTLSEDTGSGGLYINRFLDLAEGEEDIVLESTCFSHCDNCETLLSAVEEAGESPSYMVYPTVSDRQFTVQFVENSDSQINLFAADGRLVQAIENLGDMEVHLDVSTLESGLYFVQVVTQGSMQVTKVMVTR